MTNRPQRRAFERAYRRRRTFDRRRGEERAWLFGIARNASLDELRRRAHVLGVSGSAVGTRLHRVMEKLREACNAKA